MLGTFMFAVVSMLSFSACSNDDEANSTAAAVVDEVVSDQSQVYHAPALKGSEKLKFEKNSSINESTIYSFEYPSKSYTGEDILLSAKLIAWTPADRQVDDKIESVHIFNHITITADRECPTTCIAQGDTKEQELLTMICLKDYGTRAGVPVPNVGRCIMIVPDYEGYGLTKDRPHPYMAQELTARQVTDAVTYGLELYRKEAAETGSKVLPLSDDWKTFAFGYSQGGSTTLAVHRYIEQQGLDKDLHFTGSICGDGPYDLVATMRYYFDDNGNSYGVETPHTKGCATMPVVLPLIIKGMLDSHPEMKGYRIEDFLSQQLLDTGIMGWLSSKEYSTEDIEKKLVELTENGLSAKGRTYTPEQMAEMFEVKTVSSMFGTNKTVWGKAQKMFTPAAYAYFANTDNFKSVPAQSVDANTALHRALAQNSVVTGWQPKHRIVFLHSKSDMAVPYANYLSFKEAHAGDEGTLFKVFDDAFSTKDHVDGGFMFFTSLGLMHGLAPYFKWLAE